MTFRVRLSSPDEMSHTEPWRSIGWFRSEAAVAEDVEYCSICFCPAQVSVGVLELFKCEHMELMTQQSNGRRRDVQTAGRDEVNPIYTHRLMKLSCFSDTVHHQHVMGRPFGSGRSHCFHQQHHDITVLSAHLPTSQAEQVGFCRPYQVINTGRSVMITDYCRSASTVEESPAQFMC